jgi:hypothetical protein
MWHYVLDLLKSWKLNSDSVEGKNYFQHGTEASECKNCKNYAYVKILIFLLIMGQTDCSKISIGHCILNFHNAMSIS